MGMKITYLVFVISFLLGGLIVSGVVSGMTSSNYITDVLLSNGGGETDSSNYFNRIMGGILSGDVISSTTYNNYIGFYEGLSSYLSSCLDFNSCNESVGDSASNCDITQNCLLYSELCTDNVCDFGNFTISSTLYTLNDSQGVNANNLTLNLSGIITFLPGNTIDFSGKNWSQGGNAGILNITVYSLFNTTRAMFRGLGGYSTGTGNTGGNGGILQLNYWGLIRNFTDDDNDDEVSDNIPSLTAGSSLDSGSGTATAIIYNKFNTTYQQTRKDVDFNGDGVIDSTDYAFVVDRYNNLSTGAGWDPTYDINSDNKINILDLYRVGFQWARGS